MSAEIFLFEREFIVLRKTVMFILMFISIFSLAIGEELSVIEQAKDDAKADTARHSWVVLGACFPGAIVAGALLAVATAPDLFDAEIGTGMLLGGIAGFVIQIAVTDSKVVIPPERLLGKSPEYIKEYTITYRNRVKRIRRESAAAGCGFSAFLLSLWVALDYYR